MLIDAARRAITSGLEADFTGFTLSITAAVGVALLTSTSPLPGYAPLSSAGAGLRSSSSRSGLFEAADPLPSATHQLAAWRGTTIKAVRCSSSQEAAGAIRAALIAALGAERHLPFIYSQTKEGYVTQEEALRIACSMSPTQVSPTMKQRALRDQRQRPPETFKAVNQFSRSPSLSSTVEL